MELLHPAPAAKKLLCRGPPPHLSRDVAQLHLNEGQQRRRLNVGDPGPAPEEKGEARGLEQSAAVEHSVSSCNIGEKDDEIFRFGSGYHHGL
jgi:hypothetical protein